MKKFFAALLMLVAALVSPITSEAISLSKSVNLYQHYGFEPISQLEGKKIKRAIPSSDGTCLYILAHDADLSATILVYDHIGKKVKEILGTSQLVDGRINSTTDKTSGDVIALSDIAVTDDGYLVGMGCSVLPRGVKDGGVYIYKWDLDASGVATGDVNQWLVSSTQGDYSNAECGRTMCYKGATDGGYIYYTAVTTGNSKGMRYVRLEIGPDGQIIEGINNLEISSFSATESVGYAEPLMYVSPYTTGDFIIRGKTSRSDTEIYAREIKFAETERGTAQLATYAETFGGNQQHTPMFNHEGRIYAVTADINGPALADVSNGLAYTSRHSETWIEPLALSGIDGYVAAGTSNDGHLSLFMINGGTITKYSTVEQSVTDPAIPEWVDVLTYDGYSKTQLLWDIPEGSMTPDAYDIYRDGVLIESNLQTNSYIDNNVPAGLHSYMVASVYRDNSDLVGESAIRIIEVASKSSENIAYNIERCYHYSLAESDEAFGTGNDVGQMPYAYNQDIYCQGKLFQENDGSLWWYVVQRQVADKGVVTSGEGNEGGIIRIPADAADAADMASKAQKIITFEANATVGFAMDDYGNIFVREKTPYPVETVVGNDVFAAGTYTEDAFKTHFSKGRVYKRDVETGTYSGVYKTYDFSALGLTHNAADYYEATGNIYDGDGCIYISPSGMENGVGYKLFIDDGVYDHAAVQMTETELKEDGVGNYYFPINAQGGLYNQRQGIIQVGSNGYVVVNADGNMAETILSQSGNIGHLGASAAWFNGDMFFISSSNQNNSGFDVSKVVKADGSEIINGVPGDAYFSDGTMIPIVREEVGGSAESMWFGLVRSDDVSAAAVEPGSEDAVMDIYVYVPGVCFAKYKFVPYISRLNPEASMDVYVKQNNIGTEILDFEGKASWRDVPTDESDYRLRLYEIKITKKGEPECLLNFMAAKNESGILVVCDENGNPVDSDIVINSEFRDENGAVVADGVDTWHYVVVSGLDGDMDYTISVEATLEKKTDSQETRFSDVMMATDFTNYSTVSPNGTVVIDQEGDPFRLPEWNGSDMVLSKDWRVNYRVDVDFNGVSGRSFEGESVPVSHYEVYYAAHGVNEENAVKVENFTLIEGDKRTIMSKVPGDYDFDTSKDYAIPTDEGDAAENEKLKPSVLTFYIQPIVTVPDGVENPGKGEFTFKNANDNPSNGNFYLRAVYAAGNERIKKAPQTGMPMSTAATTGVQSELVNLSLENYIVMALAGEEIVVHSVTPIESVVIYNVAGVVVSNVGGNGEYMQRIDIGSMDNGIYFVSINGWKAHRFLKR